MIEWLPFDNAEVVNVALPLLSVPVPSCRRAVLESHGAGRRAPARRNRGGELYGRTESGRVQGGGDGSRVVACLTVCVSAAEVLPLKSVLPP